MPKSIKSGTREPLLKGNAQCIWPPCTNRFGSAHFYIENITNLFTKQATLTSMDKHQTTEQNLGWVFNFRNGNLLIEHFWCCQVKLPNLKLKTWPLQLLGYLPLVIALGVRSLPFQLVFHTGIVQFFKLLGQKPKCLNVQISKSSIWSKIRSIKNTFGLKL